MPGRRVIITQCALDDLEGIWRHIANQATADTAGKVISKILDATEQLSMMPGMGHTRPEIPAQYRVWCVYRYLIV